MILQLAPLDASYSYDCECLNVKYRKVLSDPKDVGRILHCNFTLRILNASRKRVYLYFVKFNWASKLPDLLILDITNENIFELIIDYYY